MSLPHRTWAEMEKLFVHLHDGAKTMAGKKKGFQTIIKRVSPNADLAHCVMHREELASRQISPELKRFMTDDGKPGQFHQNKSLKAQLSPHFVRRLELNIQLCCFTVRLGGSHQVKCSSVSSRVSSVSSCFWRRRLCKFQESLVKINF